MGDVVFVTGRGTPAPQDVVDDGLPPALRGTLAAAPALVLALVLALAGLYHPHHLTHQSSGTWWGLHVAGLFAFPLVGLALAAQVRGRRDPVAVVAVLGAFLYATAYIALDVINGIGAGFVTSRLGTGEPQPDEVRSLFLIGSPLGAVGSWALVAAAVLVAVDALVRRGLLAGPGLLLVPGALLVHTDHIFWPWGILGMVLVALGTGCVEAVYIRRE
jgi:hypothetical protein